MEFLRNYVMDKIKNYPQHETEIRDLYQLCLDEIEEGGSAENETYLCMNDIEEVIKN